MPIYTGSKGPPGSLYPPNAIATVLGRLEPLLTPDQLKSRYLKGIQLTLKIKDPDTGKPYKIMDEELKDYIDLAIDEAEQETGLTLFPTKFSNKLPYQRQDYEQFGYLQLPHRPISSIDSFTVKLADNSEIFRFPVEWIETANLIWGQLNIIPLAFQSIEGGGGVVGVNETGATGTAVFFNSLWNRPWVAAMLNVEYTTGFPDGMMPKSVNDLIGTIATMRVLSQIAAAYAGQTSVSLGIDGMSQSIGTPGPNRYQVRMQELADHRKLLVRKLKKAFGTSFVVGTV
jgi:hypothetical protein